MFVNSDWRAGMENVAREIDNAFGECVRVIPTRTKPNMQAIPLYDEAFVVTATFTWRSKMVFKQNSGTMFQTQEPFLETRVPTFTFSRHNLPRGLTHLMQIERLCDGTIFEITSIEPDGVSRITAHVNQLGRQKQ